MDARQAFVARCDAYAERAGIARVTVSKKLFGQTHKLDDLAKLSVDVGVARLQKAETQLAQMEAQLPPVDAGSDPPPDRAEA